MTSWINGLAVDPPSVSADPPPAQDLPSAPVTPPAWYESPGVQGAAVVLMLLAFLGYPVSAGWRRLRGRRSAPPVGWAARLVAAGGPVVVVGTAGYLLYVVATGATAVTSTVLGRPPLWLALQIAALGVVVAAVVTAVRWRRANPRPTSSDHRRLGILLAGAAIFLPWAIYWGLLTP